MNKRIIVVICIFIAVASFLAGELYRDEEFRPIGGEQWIEDGELHTRHLLYFEIPLKTTTADKWLDWMIREHNYYIDNEIFIRKNTLELHQKYIDMYEEIKVIFQEFDEENK